jgi:hypothetical protein
MKLQAIVSSVALAAALTFSGAAVAQNMLNGMEIPADQIQTFQDRCEALRAESTASLTTDSNANIDQTTTSSVDSEDPVTSSSTDADPAAQDNWDTALASLTLEQCDEAGFAAAM